MPERFLARMLVRLIGAYQYLLSPWVGNSCRYWPTCSEYAREAIERHYLSRLRDGAPPLPITDQRFDGQALSTRGDTLDASSHVMADELYDVE